MEGIFRRLVSRHDDMQYSVVWSKLVITGSFKRLSLACDFRASQSFHRIDTHFALIRKAN